MKKVLLTLTALIVAVTLASCGGASVPTEIAPVAGDDAATVAATINKSLAPLSYGVFAYNSARVQNLSAVEMIAPALRSAQKSVPKGYVLTVIGHNDKYEKKSSIGYRRAKAVMNELRGFKMSFVSVKAVNGYDKDMVKDVNGGDPQQRRVTFKVVKK